MSTVDKKEKCKSSQVIKKEKETQVRRNDVSKCQLFSIIHTQSHKGLPSIYWIRYKCCWPFIVSRQGPCGDPTYKQETHTNTQTYISMAVDVKEEITRKSK